MPLTDAQLAARRQNAQKSTGPRTEKGKARSRVNALKHGLRGAVAFRPDDAHAIDRRAADLAAELRPNGPSETILVRQIAWASLRLERLQTEDEHARQSRPAAAFDALQTARDAEITSLLEQLHDPDPLLGASYFRASTPPLPIDRAAIIAQLESTPDGCAELADLWDDLLQTIDTPNTPLPLHHLQQLPRLLGHAGPVTPTSPATINDPYRAALALTGNPDPSLPTPDAARQTLRTLAQSQIHALTQRLEQLWQISDAALFTDVAHASTTETDLSPETTLRQRYLNTATRDLHRAYALLDQGRKSHRLWTPASTPEPTNEPKAIIPPAPNEPKPTTPVLTKTNQNHTPAHQTPVNASSSRRASHPHPQPA